MRLVDIYRLIYYSLVTIFSFMQINSYKNYQLNTGKAAPGQIPSFFLMIFCILMIGLRPVNDYWFGDSYVYNYSYSLIYGGVFSFNPASSNIIWDNLFNFLAANQIDLSFLFLFADILYFGCAYLACRKMFPKDYSAAYLVFLGAFSTFSFSYNGIKAGVAASIFILALAYRKNLLLSTILVLISWGFHHSMQLPVAAYILALIYKKPKTYFIVWCLCLLIAIFHISFFQNLFASMTDETGTKYLTQDADNWGGKSGLRLDFILYSAVPIYIAYIAMYKKKILLSSGYTLLLNIYMITNAVWMLCMYAQFTNRIAYLSWFLYPFVLIYPFINENWGKSRYKALTNTIMYQLLFTLFMEYIVY